MAQEKISLKEKAIEEIKEKNTKLLIDQIKERLEKIEEKKSEISELEEQIKIIETGKIYKGNKNEMYFTLSPDYFNNLISSAHTTPYITPIN